MYFRLNPECFFIKGDNCSAIYDLIEGEIHSLNAEETRLIQGCENNQNVTGNEPFLNELKSRCIGNYYDSAVYIQKLRLGSPILDYQPGQPPLLAVAFLEINNSCNESCWFCGTHGIHRSLGCMGCNIWAEDGLDLGIEDWKQFIDELVDLKCNVLFFTGGDLTLKWDMVKELLNYAQTKFSQIFVIINGKRFTETLAEDIKGKSLPIIQTDNITDVINGNQYLLVSDANINVPKESTLQKKVSLDWISPDFSHLPRDSRLITKTKIQNTDIFRFSHTKKKHPCLANSITISWRGDILPCPMLRKHSLGNVKNQHLFDFFKTHKEELEKFWRLNLDNIQKCKNCEFRYSCNDCRALEETLTGDLYGKKLCNYDVTKGVWV
jgi:radical SAM protein with 4Fe4S-binding SPASM domain